MNTNKKNNKNAKTNTTVSKRGVRRRVQALSTKPFNSVVNQRILENRLNKAINETRQISKNIQHTPLYKYIAGLIDFDEVARSNLTPMLPGKYHLKTVRLTQTYQVNANGNLIMLFQPYYMTEPDSTSTQGYCMYNNSAAYDPSSTSATGTATLITDFLTALNLTSTIMPRVRTQSMHLRFHLTGVSNLNKQGTIHLMETLISNRNSSAAYETTLNIPYAPLCEVYRQVEIANMDLSCAMQYNFFPLSNSHVISQFNDVTNRIATSAFDVDPNKIFALIVSGAAAGTKIRMEAELTAECEVEKGYINTYPIEYTKCFIDSEPTMCFLNQHPELRISVSKQSYVKFLPTIFKEVRKQTVPESYIDLSGNDNMSVFSSRTPMSTNTKLLSW